MTVRPAVVYAMSGSKGRLTRQLSPRDWEHLPDEQILDIRIRDLGLQIPGSPLDPFVDRLYAELDARGVCAHPPCALADEWCSPSRIPVIGIPFCLAHARLKHIERKMMLEVEGGTEASCMKLLRHECGHAVNYAYRLYTRTRWRELFGPFSTKYFTSYSFQPYSRRYVIHLEDNYAQAHPDEDFAETFAVWLTPGSDWAEKYGDRPVIRKLRYVADVMRRVGSAPPPVPPAEMPWSASRMTSTLRAHYERKRRYAGEDFPGYYDDILLRLFSAGPGPGARGASRFLREHRRRITDSVSAWTGQRKYDIHELVTRLIRRCDDLGLYANTPDIETVIGVTSLITAVANKALSPSRRTVRR